MKEYLDQNRKIALEQFYIWDSKGNLTWVTKQQDKIELEKPIKNKAGAIIGLNTHTVGTPPNVTWSPCPN